MKPHSGELDERGVHHFPVRVYYSDTDAGGIVYHSNYLDFAEHGRTEMIDGLIGGHKHNIITSGAGFVVSSINIHYKKPAMLDDILRVETAILKCERFTLLLSQDIYRDDELLCQLEVKAAYISLKEGRPLPLPEDWRTKMAELQELYTQSKS